jgi:hypothetical protein
LICTSAQSNVLTITVNNPQVTGTTPGSICAGSGTVTLGATGSPGSTLNWYAAATGETSLGTGTSYNTPSISSTTSYYVESLTATSYSGLGNTSIPTSTGASAERGIVFTTNSAGKIVSAQYYSPTTNVTNNITVKLRNNATSVVQTLTLTVNQGSSAGWYTMNLNFEVDANTSYRLLASFSQSVNRISSGANYASSSFNNLSPLGTITGGFDSFNSSTTYNYFHNINVEVYCKSPRTEVVATVTTPPSISTSATSSTICSGQSTTLSATSVNSGYTYTWSNSLGSGASVSASPTSTTTYTVTGTDNSGGASNGCSNTATVAVTVNPLPSAITITPAAPTICNGDISNIVASGGTISSSYTNAQNFTSLGTPAGWSLTQPTGMTVSVNSSANAGGSANELVFEYTSTNASALALATMPVIDATNLSNLSISFKSFLDNYSATTYPYSIKLQTSTNNSTWSDAWTFTPSGSTTYTPTTVNTALSSLNGSPTAYIRFAFVGNTFGINLWYVDDISVTGTNSISTSLVWSPSTELYTNAGATTAYNGSATTSVYAKPSTTTTYTATATSAAGCTSTNTVQVTVNPLPTATWASTATTVCSSSSAQTTTLAYSATTNSPTSYSITWNASPTNSFAAVTDQSFAGTAGGGTITISVPAGTAAGEYTGTITVKNGNSCVSSSSSFTVTVNQSPAITTTTGLTGVATCGKLSIDVQSNGQSGQGEWTIPSNQGSIQAVVNSPTEPSASFSPASTGAFNTPITVRWTNANSCFAETTIQFNQPNTSSLGTPVVNDILWGGLTNTSWTTSTNWYKYTNNGNLNYWSQLTSGSPEAPDKVYTIVNTSGGICIGNNVADVGTNSSVLNLQVSSGTSLNLSNGDLTITGNLVNNGTINPGTGTVTFNGTSNQAISGAGSSTFNNMIVNKATGHLSIGQPAKVTGTLTMIKGDILTTTNNILEIGSSATNVGQVSWSPSAGTILGPLKRWFSATPSSSQSSGIFPVGADLGGIKGVTNRYAQINFTESTAGGYIIAEYRTGTPSTGYTGLPITYNTNQYIQNYEEEGYWDITPYSSQNGEYGALNTSQYTLKLRMNNPSTLQPGQPPSGSNGNVIDDISNLRIIRARGGNPYNHQTWELAGNQGDGQTVLNNGDYLLEETGVQGFSWFNGGGNDNNPLPVELLSFNGTCNEGMVDLLWQTASEFNSSHFDVEKSTDGETWRVMATVPSAGTSNELLTYQAMDNSGTNGSNYYRLRQVDIDGKEKLYDPINVSCDETTAGYFTSYPNPSGNDFQVVVNNKEILGACTLNIVDAQGKVIDQRKIEVKDGINMFVINQELTPGIYFLNISNGSKSTPVLRHAIK